LTFSVWLERTFYLEDAQALLAELKILEERYSSLPEPEISKGKPFFLRLALSPM
jgi:hypothetical protein